LTADVPPTTAMPATTVIDQAMADALTLLAALAGDAIKGVAPDRLGLRRKADHSPVCAADEAAQRLIIAALAERLPGVPVISEEQTNRDTPPADGTFLLVDPLDGTKEFIAGRGEFTVNLAILHKRYPVAGFIAVPAFDLVYRGIIGKGAERITIDRRGDAPAIGTRTVIQTRKAPADGLVAAMSRSHQDPATAALLAQWPVKDRIVIGSALKFCRLAEGEIDVYPRLGRVREWDLAAGHAIVAAAGGLVTRPDGAPLTYGHAETDYAVDGFLAWGDPARGDPQAARARP